MSVIEPTECTSPKDVKSDEEFDVHINNKLNNDLIIEHNIIEHYTTEPKLLIAPHDHETVNISDFHDDEEIICRYCMDPMHNKMNMSRCRCNGFLCAECLKGEINLTESRSSGEIIECTVCKTPYDVTFKLNQTSYLEKIQFLSNPASCGTILLNPSKRELAGLCCVLIGVTFWVITASTLATSTKHKDSPFYFQITLCLMDIGIGVVSIWFSVHLEWGTLLYLIFLNISRTCYHATYIATKKQELSRGQYIDSLTMMICSCLVGIMVCIMCYVRYNKMWF
eukprot:UN24644